MRGVAHIIGQEGLRELAALFRAARDRSGFLVCCDSGPMHLAEAVGLPVVCLAGPQDARRTGPWPLPGQDSLHVVVRATPEPSCAPCLSRSCAHREGPVCMDRIEPEAVVAAARLSWESPGSHDPAPAPPLQDTRPCSPSSSSP